MSNIAHQRLRLRYRKDDVLKYIGHQDLLRFILRVLRRAEFPYAMSGGYSPKPRVTFGPALPLGVSAAGELADIELREGTAWRKEDIDCALRKLEQAAEPRDFALELIALADGSPSIAMQAVAARYHISVDCESNQARQVLEEGDLTWESRQGKIRDLSLGIIQVAEAGAGICLDGGISDEANLNVVHLARCLSERHGVESTALHRVGLLDAEGELL